ncbi:MAG: GxxExxY protein [Candidatus Moraniibacteriota bacterium]
MNKEIKEEKVIYKELSYRIVGILFEVYNDLGYGYQEKYYERAVIECFKEANINFKNQVAYKVKFKNAEIGKYFLDFLVEDKVVLELKKGNHFPKRNIEQVKGYLKVTKKKLAILANFTAKDVKFLRILNID